MILRQFDFRLKPELGFALCGSDVNMHTVFFKRKEEESIAAFTEDCRTHRQPSELKWSSGSFA
tara:strand:+ start:720 stop:908 length:189 start_codon:yes stop_codon:yes gene_type:complete